MKHFFLFLSVLVFLSGCSDPAPLDDAYPAPHPPIQDLQNDFLVQSDVGALIALQSPVKSQDRRGVCSIFSAIGILESWIKIRKNTVLDLSENYLAYIVTTQITQRPFSGSTASDNFRGVQKRGLINEEVWPYEGQDWTKPELSQLEIALRDATCFFVGLRQDLCIKTHRDPYQNPFFEEASTFAREFKTENTQAILVSSLSDIRNRILVNEPVLLEIDFFYGAWNHRKMSELGIGEPDSDKWDKGMVGIPTSLDVALSKQKPAGHSLVIVGFDDVERVYYFKNSWGTESFGLKSDLLGPGTTPGYGTIPFEYAHQYGSFYRIEPSF
ncbi:MAG: C1 family peptidase [Pseudomonadota bacterium]